MAQFRRTKSQRQLFEEEVPGIPVRIQLPLSVQEQLRQTLRQWDAGAGQENPGGGRQ